jgi:tetratricopeptide (TPR) repeat protein
VARLVLGDADSWSRRLDQAERVSRGDLRVPLARLMQQLAASDEAPDARLDVRAAEVLKDALLPLTALRSDGAEGEGGSTPHAAVLSARAAMRRRDVAAVVTALSALEKHQEFARASAWLQAALASTRAELRPLAVAALERVAAASAQRALCARALEAGDVTRARRMAAEAAEGVLSAGDRLVVAALAGGSLEAFEGPLAEARTDEEHAVLAAAVAAAVDSNRAAAQSVGEDAMRAALALGRELGAAALGREARVEPAFGEDSVDVPLDEPTGDAIRGGLGPNVAGLAADLLDADNSDGAARVVLLEHAYRTGQIAKVAEHLAGEGLSGAERERALFAAVCAEKSGDQERLQTEVERAIAASPEDEAATRMAMAVGDGAAAAASLSAFADAVAEPLRAAVALTEAGLRLMEEEGQEADGEALLRKAAERHADVPIPGFIGMYIAQALGDVEGERYWLERRRAVAGSPADAVAETLRLALRLDAGSVDQASMLEEAHRARPDDFGLRDLYEQAAGTGDDRAQWLLGRAEKGPDGAPLLLEAALSFEFGADIEQASSAARRAVDIGGDPLAPIFARRYAMLGHGADAVVAELEGEIRRARDARERRELAEILARIELYGRGDRERAVSQLREALRHGSAGETPPGPDELGALALLERMAIEGGASEGLGDVALAIARVLTGPESVAHSMLAARIVLASKGWEETYEPVQLAFGADDPSLWSLRQMAAHARARGDHATAATIDRSLGSRAATGLDKATLLLRAAEAMVTSAEEDPAAELLSSALDAWPRHPVALLGRAAQLERTGMASAAAQAYEELALACQSPEQRASRLYKAATLWSSSDDPTSSDEARRLLEAVAGIDPTHADTFDRLQAIYLAGGAKRELANLLGARLESVSDPAERVRLEILRGRMLAEAGSAAEAREALAAALEANPDNTDALGAYAEVCAAESDWEATEQALIQLCRLLAAPEDQARIYLDLGVVYDEHLPNDERAEMAYQEVLKRQPENATARERLVGLYLRAGDVQRAFAEQQQLIDAAQTPEDKCARTVRLADIHEAAGDLKEAEQTLVKARRTFPKEADPVLALYRFYKRSGQEPAADLLLERAQAEVRRGLGAGRFEAPLFAMASAVSELKGQMDAAQVARATLGALTGEPSQIEGAGLLAGSPELDDLTAPDVFVPAFRTLLRATGAALDAAVPFDAKALRVKPLPPPNEDILERTREIAGAYGLPEVHVHATNALGLAVVAAQVEPPTLCFGLPLVTHDNVAARDFLIHRAVKTIQTRTAAFARTAPIDLWPLLAAYLKLHSPSFQPSGVEPQKVALFQQRMAEALQRGIDPKLSLLAGEVIGAIGNRASSLNSLANAWGSRSALLALGDPNLALEAIAWASGSTQGPPTDGAERVRWVGRNAEARDIIVFSVSDGYAAARSQLGLDAALESVEVMPDE